MSDPREINTQPPEYLKDKEAAEQRQEGSSEKQDPESPDEKRLKERVLDAVISDTFQH